MGHFVTGHPYPRQSRGVSHWTKEDFERAKKELESGEADVYDDEIYPMIVHGCLPDVDYYLITEDFFYNDVDEYNYHTSYEDAENELFEIYTPDWELVAEWDEMSDSELKDWCQILDWIAQGYAGWGEVTEKESEEELD